MWPCTYKPRSLGLAIERMETFALPLSRMRFLAFSEANWEKVSETMKANGATASFSAAALLSSAVLAVVAAALQP